MRTNEIVDLIEYLEYFITDERREQFYKVLSERTRYFTVVLEDIYQPQNASAVLRTCDCFGIQDIHVIENKNEFIINRDVVLGSTQWLNINKYSGKEDNTKDCLTKLKSDGYRIIATSPHINDLNLSDFNIESGKAAFVFGTEKFGISNSVREMADEFIKIPMYGFTESYNISVSAAMILNNITERIRKSEIKYQLSEEEKAPILLNWLRNTIKKVDLIEEKYKEMKFNKG